MGGYYDGPSVSGTLGVSDIFEKVPVGFEIGLGYSWTPAGDGILARRVFINDNTGGDNDAQSSGGVLDFNFNVTYPLNQTYGPVKFYVYGGPRIGHYDVRWDYVGGDEDFDIVANSWGLWIGRRPSRRHAYRQEHFNAVMQLGLDYYFPTSIYGHDATYYPNNSNVNARTNNQGYTYTYADAEQARRPFPTSGFARDDRAFQILGEDSSLPAITNPTGAFMINPQTELKSHLTGNLSRSVWFDLPVANLPDAMSFYEGLLGWKYQQMEDSPLSDYVMIDVGGQLIGGLRKVASPGLRPPSRNDAGLGALDKGAVSPWSPRGRGVGGEAPRVAAPILYFTVDQLAPKVARAKELGAEIVGPTVDLGKDRGRYQWVRDREGISSMW